MQTQRNILVAFVLNLGFSLFELVGGLITGSVAILSDAVHDLGDAASIGASYCLERKSCRQADERFTYGYQRYSALGGFITTLILVVGSVLVVCGAINRISQPVEIDYSGMIVLSLIGVVVNACAALVTHKGDSLNQRAVNLHMLEDVLGWVVVLVGAVVMRFTDFVLIDSLMSIGVALFILFAALKNLGGICDLFLLKTPKGIDVGEIKRNIEGLEGVEGLRRIQLLSLDERTICASLLVVSNEPVDGIVRQIREILLAHHIDQGTIEVEAFCLE